MIQVFSYGGGVQSTAALVLAAQRKLFYVDHFANSEWDLPYRTFLFCNVGDDSENPKTLAYYREVAVPYAKKHGINLIELQRTWQKGERTGQPVTLKGLITAKGNKSIEIPVYLERSGSPGNRTCTIDFKIEVVDRWLREHGAKETGAVVGLGISTDEWHRARKESGVPWKTLHYPLLDMRLSRRDCVSIIEKEGLPIPPKSACTFCPFTTTAQWQTMRNEEPEQFEGVCNLDDLLRARSIALGHDPVWLSRKRIPLRKLTTDLVQGKMFEEQEEQETCESGYCMM